MKLKCCVNEATEGFTGSQEVDGKLFLEVSPRRLHSNDD